MYWILLKIWFLKNKTKYAYKLKILIISYHGWSQYYRETWFLQFLFVASGTGCSTSRLWKRTLKNSKSIKESYIGLKFRSSKRNHKSLYWIHIRKNNDQFITLEDYPSLYQIKHDASVTMLASVCGAGVEIIMCYLWANQNQLVKYVKRV